MPRKPRWFNTPWAWFMCLLASFFYGYEFFLRVAPSVMSQAFMSHFEISDHQFGIMSSYYFLAYTPLQLFVGTLVDFYGVRRLLTLAIAFCIVGTVGFVFIDDFVAVKWGRFLIGAGSAFAFVSVLKVASDSLPIRWFTWIAGGTTAIGMMGAILAGSKLPMWIAEVGLEPSFMYSMLVALVLLVLSAVFMRDATLLSHKGNTFFSVFKGVLEEVWSVMRKPQIWINALTGMCLFMPTTMFAGLWGVPYLMEGKAMSAVQAGAVNTSIFYGWLVGGLVIGGLSDFFKCRVPLMRIGALCAFVAVMVLLYGDPHNLYVVVGLLFLIGFFSSVEILSFSICHELAPLRLCGTAVALTNTFIMMGGFLQPVIGWLLDMHKVTARPVEADYQFALAIIPVSFLVAVILTFMLKETYGLTPED